MKEYCYLFLIQVKCARSYKVASQFYKSPLPMVLALIMLFTNVVMRSTNKMIILVIKDGYFCYSIRMFGSENVALAT